ncbi:hypothetical protein FIBSPDRAFT_858971 [Athelia psychrophila]|uniref:Uncharacterized protein n=1 Tax=Athelia psychrophila TaxID=1759441 RepID=A0A166LJL2_9AGAM|nr:hypothetical protein FIBSPDRAFT_858971 [Fibularhizoctonia sp. CBS 109695]
MKPVWATSSDDAKTLNHNLFNTPAPQTPHAHPWAPPPPFSPEKAFPQSLFPELRDVNMSESSPPNPELRHVYQSRQPVEETSSDDAETLNHNMFGATPQTLHGHFWAPSHPFSRDTDRSQSNPEGGDGAVAPGASLISRFMRRCFGTE